MHQLSDNTYLLWKNDEKTLENANKINEEVQGMGDKIFIAMPALLNDQLSVIQNKTTHQQQS